MTSNASVAPALNAFSIQSSGTPAVPVNATLTDGFARFTAAWAVRSSFA